MSWLGAQAKRGEDWRETTARLYAVMTDQKWWYAMGSTKCKC
jgi:hypothetical protein